jgi:hypothetical protein
MPAEIKVPGPLKAEFDSEVKSYDAARKALEKAPTDAAKQKEVQTALSWLQTKIKEAEKSRAKDEAKKESLAALQWFKSEVEGAVTWLKGELANIKQEVTAQQKTNKQQEAQQAALAQQQGTEPQQPWAQAQEAEAKPVEARPVLALGKGQDRWPLAVVKDAVKSRYDAWSLEEWAVNKLLGSGGETKFFEKITSFFNPVSAGIDKAIGSVTSSDPGWRFANIVDNTLEKFNPYKWFS